MKDKKIIILLVLAIIAALLGAVYLIQSKDTKPTEQPQVKNEEPTEKNDLVRKEVDPSKLPEKFPADMPMEAGATVTQNYNATGPDGGIQASRAFITAKTLAENITIYRNYLTKAGYDVKEILNRDNIKVLYGVKGNTSITVAVNENSVNKEKVVNISYTESTRPAAAPAR